MENGEWRMEKQVKWNN